MISVISFLKLDHGSFRMVYLGSRTAQQNFLLFNSNDRLFVDLEIVFSLNTMIRVCLKNKAKKTLATSSTRNNIVKQPPSLLAATTTTIRNFFSTKYNNSVNNSSDKCNNNVKLKDRNNFLDALPSNYDPAYSRQKYYLSLSTLQQRFLTTATASSNNGYQFYDLFKTNHQGLPRLPIPILNDTCERYLNSVKHLCTSAEQFETILAEVQDFKSNIGPELHQKLLQKDEGFASLGEEGPAFYFEKAWDDAYLAARYPNPVNVNPFYMLKNHDKPELQNPCSRVAHFIHSAIKWQTSLTNNTLAAEPRPACVCNLGKQMGTARIPGVESDVLKETPNAKHVVFQSNGGFFKLRVLDSNNNVLHLSDLIQQIENIVASTKVDNNHAIGNFTTMERTKWANTRNHLKSISDVNVASLNDIDEALLLINMNMDAGTSLDQKSTDMLLGENRWFDKHQVIVHGDGTIGMNFEHSHSDGTTWNRMVHEIWHDMHSNGETSAYGPMPTLSAFNGATSEPLIFVLDDALKSDLNNASNDWLQICDNIDLKSMIFTDYGKNDIKKMKMSPDAVGQIAFQLSYRKIHGKPAPVYESCSTRGYFRGRTETIRSSSDAMFNFTTSMVTNVADKAKSRELMYLAADRHVELAKEAAVGNGIDRHLMAMKIIATEEGRVDTIPIFNNPMYSYSSDFLISSSNVTSPELSIFGFGATSANGYGVGYQILEDSIPICITSYHGAPDTNTSDYIESIKESLFEIRELAMDF
jgi:carnitine O-palmitoyltransferase 2